MQAMLCCCDFNMHANPGGWGVLTPKIRRRGQSMFWPSLKCHILSFKTVVELDNYKFHIIKDEKDLCQKWKVKLFFSRCLKQFDGLAWLTRTPYSTPLVESLPLCSSFIPLVERTFSCPPGATCFHVHSLAPTCVDLPRTEQSVEGDYRGIWFSG